MKEVTWFDWAARIWMAVTGGAALFALFWRKERKQANATISKTENENYKQVLENKIAERHISEIIEADRKITENKYKEQAWDQQKEHYEVKLDIQEKLIKTLKANNELEQENEILKNELQTIREEYQSCHREVEALRKEVAELRKLNNK